MCNVFDPIISGTPFDSSSLTSPEVGMATITIPNTETGAARLNNIPNNTTSAQIQILKGNSATKETELMRYSLDKGIDANDDKGFLLGHKDIITLNNKHQVSSFSFNWSS